MIQNLIHTVSKDKAGLHGAVKADNSHSKGGNGLEGQFRALFHSFNSDSEISEKTFSDKEMMENSEETELNIKKSLNVLSNSEPDTDNNQTDAQEQIQTQGKRDHSDELAQKLAIEIDEADLDENLEEYNFKNKPVYNKHELTGRSLDMKEDPLSQTGSRMAATNNDAEGAAQDEESQKMINNDSDILSNRGSIENFDGISDESVADENLTKGSADESEAGKNGLAGQYLKNNSDFESSDKNREQRDLKSAEKTKNPILNSESNTTSGVNLEKEIPESAKVDLSNRAEVNAVKSDFNREEKSETEETNGNLNNRVKSEGSTLLNKGDIEDVGRNLSKSKTDGHSSVIQKGDEKVTSDSGRAVSNENEKISSGPDSLASNENEKISSGPDSLASNETDKVSPEKESASLRESGIDGEQDRRNGFLKSGLSEAQSQQAVYTSGREQGGAQAATSFSGETVMDRGLNQQESDTGNEQIRRFVHGNFENAVRSTQKPVESSVLMQDKVQPKRERNDLSFINGDLKESSRISIPGFGEARTVQSIPNSSGELNDKSGSFSDSEQSEIFWKEHTAEMDEPNELKKSELSISALSKLGDSTLTNHFLRKVLLPGLTQTVLTASSQSDRAENWQRHNFVLEDGSKVQLSARTVDGVLQIRLGSSIGELSKLLQIHQDEIREHLEKECNIQIELQFDNGSEDQDQSSLENFFGEEGKKPAFGSGIEVGSQDRRGAKQKINEVVPRNFGYNSKEWTA